MANYIPISKEHHRTAGWIRFQDYNHSRGDSLVPLMVTELTRAQQSLPICFTQVNDKVLPAAILGVAHGRNLFVAPNGRWVEAYVPAHVRSYPFRLAQASGNQRVLCIDQSSGLMTTEGTGFFNDDGQSSTELQSILEFLQSIESARAPTEQICKMIADTGLLTPWEIKVKTNEQETALNGLLRIDEQALIALPADQLKALADAGALPVVYAQLMSMQNINKLQTLITLHEQHAAQQNNQAEVTEVFGKPDDTLKFDF